MQQASLFDDVAKYYAHRIPYVESFFEKASGQLSLHKGSRLLDLACGLGELSSGFSKYCSDITAIDNSTKMVELARSTVPKNVSLIQFDLNEPFDLDIGRFDLIAIGRALRYLRREPLFLVLDRTLGGDGSILVCGSRLDQSTPWGTAYVHAARPFRDMSKPLDPSWRNIFDNPRFEYWGTISSKEERNFSVDDLVNNTLTYGVISMTVMEHLDEFRSQLTKVLQPYFSEQNSLTGTIISHGKHYRLRKED